MKKITGMTSLLAVTLFSMSLAASAWAGGDTLRVGPGQPYESIRAAINASGPRDTILIDPGTYEENITLVGRSSWDITLQGNCFGEGGKNGDLDCPTIKSPGGPALISGTTGAQGDIVLKVQALWLDASNADVAVDVEWIHGEFNGVGFLGSRREQSIGLMGYQPRRLTVTGSAFFDFKVAISVSDVRTPAGASPEEEGQACHDVESPVRICDNFFGNASTAITVENAAAPYIYNNQMDNMGVYTVDGEEVRWEGYLQHGRRLAQEGNPVPLIATRRFTHGGYAVRLRNVDGATVEHLRACGFHIAVGFYGVTNSRASRFVSGDDGDILWSLTEADYAADPNLEVLGRGNGGGFTDNYGRNNVFERFMNCSQAYGGEDNSSQGAVYRLGINQRQEQGMTFIGETGSCDDLPPVNLGEPLWYGEAPPFDPFEFNPGHPARNRP